MTSWKKRALAITLAWLLRWFDTDTGMLAFFNELSTAQQVTAKVVTQSAAFLTIITPIGTPSPCSPKPCATGQVRYGVLYLE